MPPIVHKVLRSPGQPLDPATHAFLEPRFGHGFSRVRVHTGVKASDAAGLYASATPSPKCALAWFHLSDDIARDEGAPISRRHRAWHIRGWRHAQYADGDILPALPETTTT